VIVTIVLADSGTTLVLQPWGWHGFDVGRETPGACRGADYLV